MTVLKFPVFASRIHSELFLTGENPDFNHQTYMLFHGKIMNTKEEMGFPGGSVVKNLPATQEMQVQSLGWQDALKEEIATHSSILAWRIPWTEEPGGLQSMGYKSWTRLSGEHFDFLGRVFNLDQ